MKCIKSNPHGLNVSFLLFKHHRCLNKVNWGLEASSCFLGVLVDRLSLSCGSHLSFFFSGVT